MKHTRSSLWLVFLFLVSSLGVSAAPVLRNLQIQVVLHDNGDADIQEVRQMDIDSEGTECYIVIGHLNGSDIKDFSVTDETGQKYVNEESWNLGMSTARDSRRQVAAVW